jgi:hypothetical protein
VIVVQAHIRDKSHGEHQAEINEQERCHIHQPYRQGLRKIGKDQDIPHRFRKREILVQDVVIIGILGKIKDQGHDIEHKKGKGRDQVLVRPSLIVSRDQE